MASKRTTLGIVQQFFPDVKEVHDADESILLKVEKKDSEAAKLRDHNHCAMAMACKRFFKARGIIIAIGTAYVIKGEGAIRYLLPESVRREIVSFDRKAGFSEGTYKLSAPWKSQRLGARAERKNPVGPKRENAKEKVNNFRHWTEGIRAVLGRKD